MPSFVKSAAKIALRRQMKTILNAMTPENRTRQSAEISHRIIRMAAYTAANRVCIYLSMDNEVDTLPILRNMFKTNKKVYVPAYEGDRMAMVRLHDWNDYESLPLDKWHIKQPKFNENREDAIESGGLDLVLVPGVCFTQSGKRLGHGRGYYDRFIQAVRNGHGELSPALFVGLAFHEQMIAENELPVLEHDRLLDLIVAGTSTSEC